MQIVRLGNSVLGIVAGVRELAALGIFVQEPEAEPLLALAEQACKKEDVHSGRTGEVELCVGRERVSLLCFLRPPQRECFRFDGLGEALDGLCEAGCAPECALLRAGGRYIVSMPPGAQAGRLSEFGVRLGDGETERAWAQGELLAQGKELKTLLRKKRDGWRKG